MALTTVAEVQDQIQKAWSNLFVKELREQLLLGELISKDYEGAIGQRGDTVRVSMLQAATGQLRTVGTDADTFDAEAMQWQKVDVKADKRAVAAYDVTELAEIQSQLGAPEGQSEMRNSLLFAVAKQVNDYLWSLINPSTSSPDHLITGKASIAASDLVDYRTLAAKAKWVQDGRWYALLNPDYYGNLLNAQTLTSSDYVNGEPVVVGGQIVNKRFGFNILEDNSRISAKGLFFHPDFMLHVMQKAAQFKVSDLHPLGKFGYKISVDLIFGAKLNIDGSKKHIYVTSGASLDPSA